MKLYKTPRYFISKDKEQYGTFIVEVDGYENFWFGFINHRFWKEVTFLEYIRYKFLNFWRHP